MTIIRLGYVAMSSVVKNASPSKTMTFAQFEKIANTDAAIRKLSRLAQTNLQNCIRLLKHNVANDITFFRLSSKLVPLVNHPEIGNWNYISPLKAEFEEIKEIINRHHIRVDFHPDHFVVLNNADKDILQTSIRTLRYHYKLLMGMGVDPKHRCVLHVGGHYNDKTKALENFIENWGLVPQQLQAMVMLENDDTKFTLSDTLYLCEKLEVPMVFDYHHHLANPGTVNWREDWDRVLQTWTQSNLPVKMHISSPKSETQYRAHHEYIDTELFFDFLKEVKGSVDQIDCMIEAKKKDSALFQLMKDMKSRSDVSIINQSTVKLL
ncbi:UV damage endonuclease UvsE [Salipaludibacillus neizhouensis]|uniref:UV damage endonuclease UvsE n=1 Tax=Salipaludibacillus neizhouensis TaxID=885475 RepID=A0A3A9KB95_9BACI|nr:UV DNA damage repair endonuclease UvsE [Salipaludibacillus neizhouensis]RKL68030.1 UV damage endonuclease UvsE [Salipaludibacillus neizhouensis]